MPSERIQRRIDALLNEADGAAEALDWTAVWLRAEDVLALDAESEDGRGLMALAGRRFEEPGGSREAAEGPVPLRVPSVEQPSSFVSCCYEVRRFLGEGGKKRVSLAHDT